jgi:hypothetical protein
VRLEGQVAGNLLAEVIDRMGDRRPETGMERAAGGQPAGCFAGFEHQHFLACLGQVGSAYQSIVSGANYYRVIAVQVVSIQVSCCPARRPSLDMVAHWHIEFNHDRGNVFRRNADQMTPVRESSGCPRLVLRT